MLILQNQNISLINQYMRIRVYDGVGKADPSVEIKFGPNIVDWPKMSDLTDNLLLKVVSVIHDPVTTTDELNSIR